MEFLHLPDDVIFNIYMKMSDDDVLLLSKMNKRLNELYHDIISNDITRKIYMINHLTEVKKNECHYFHFRGMKHGIARYFVEDKIIKEEEYYLGEENGRSVIYDDNGLVRYEAIVRKNEILRYKFYMDGKLYVTGNISGDLEKFQFIS